MTRYLPARHYLWFGIAARGVGGLLRLGRHGITLWRLCRRASFLLTAVFLFVMAFRPAIEIHEGYLWRSASGSFPGWTSAAWTAPAGFRR